LICSVCNHRFRIATSISSSDQFQELGFQASSSGSAGGGSPVYAEKANALISAGNIGFIQGKHQQPVFHYQRLSPSSSPRSGQFGF
jgi:hypothetical protein